MKKLSSKISKSALGLCVMASCVTTLESSLAAGFGADLQSASGLATSYAGSSAGSHDLSDAFTNPANYDLADNTQLIISASYLRYKVDPDQVSGDYYGGGTVSGEDRGNAGIDTVIPAIHVATPLNDKVKLGLSITSPYALTTDYGEEWAGRYSASESSIRSINFNPALSYEANDKLTLGAGVQVQYLKATLTSAADITTIVGGARGSNDAFVKAKGSDLGYGYNLGLKYKFNDKVKAGLSYRSKIEHKMEGRARLSGNPIEVYSDFDMKITTPESATGGLSYQASQRVELMYDINWTRWSRVQNMNLIANVPSLNNNVQFKWRDSWKNALGINFKANNDWLLRAGTAYEKDAISSTLRNPSVPTGDRIWLSAGASYKINDSLTVDASYLHQIIKNTKSHIDAQTGETVNVSSLEAKYKNTVDVFALALKWEFM